MYVNVGNKLFLPEADDYSKEGFDRQAEEVLSEGQAVLSRLRLEQSSEAQLLASIRQQAAEKPPGETKKPPRAKGGQEKKTYKEIMEEMAAKKK